MSRIRWIRGAGLVLAATLGVEVRADEPGQDEAIARIKQAGGRVDRDEAAPEKPVVGVNLGASKADDAVLEALGAFEHLKKVLLNGTGVTDAGLEQLGGLKGLAKLYLVDTKVTDAGLEHLKGLENLEVLSLVGTGVTDAGLEHLKGLPKLRELYLYGTKVTDEGAKALSEAKPDLRIDR